MKQHPPAPLRDNRPTPGRVTDLRRPSGGLGDSVITLAQYALILCSPPREPPAQSTARAAARPLCAGAAECALVAHGPDAAGRRHRDRRRRRCWPPCWRHRWSRLRTRERSSRLWPRRGRRVLLAVTGASTTSPPAGRAAPRRCSSSRSPRCSRALPDEARVVPLLPWWVERAALLVAGVYAGQSRQLHGRHRLDDGRRGRAGRRRRCGSGATRRAVAGGCRARDRAARRHARLRAVQPAGGEALSRRRRQPADRAAARSGC